MNAKKFSFYQGSISCLVPHSTISLEQVFDLIFSDKYQKQIQQIRLCVDKKVQAKHKSKLDYICFSGIFSKRNNKDLIEASQLICLDFDDLENPEAFKQQITSDEFVALAFVSPSGNGLKIVIQYEHSDFLIAWQQVVEYFESKYNLIADKSCKDICRACFLSHDTDAYFNADAKIFKVKEIIKESSKKEKIKPSKSTSKQPISKTINESDFARACLVVERIKIGHIDITNDYADWINIGFALAIFGESGRSLFHDVSNQNSKYDMKETDKKFDDFLVNGKFTSPAFFFKKAREYGVPIMKDPHEQLDTHVSQDKEFFTNGIVKYDLQNFKIFVATGKYYVTIAEGFLFYIKYQTIDEQGNYTWVLEFFKPDSEPFCLELTNDSFYDIKELERILGTKRLSLNVKNDQLQKVKAFLFNNSAIPDAFKVLRYGLNPESELYFFSNCAITKKGEILYPDNMGMLKFKDFYFSLPQINKNQNSPFIYTENDIKFNNWYLLFAQAQREEITFLAASFFLFSLFRDIGIAVNSFSPIFFITGIAGTAKSTVFLHLNYLFGANAKEMGVNLKGRNSEAGFNAKAEQRSNGLIFADEYAPNHLLTPALQGFYDNKGYSKMNMNSKSHLDTIDLTPKCAIGIASNFLPTLPEDEPFFSRLVLIINNNRERTEDQKNAFKELQLLQEAGITNVLREIWMHRDLVKKEYKSAYQTLKNALETHFKSFNIGNPRYIYNIAQILTVPYILSVHGKIEMCEATSATDILAEFIKRSEKSILDSDNTVKEKTPLKEFFEFMQELNDKGYLLEGVHYKFIGTDIQVNLDRLYKKFQFEFRKMNRFEIQAPSIQTIQDEILTFVGLDTNNEMVKDQFFKKMRFKNETENHKTDFARNTFKINYPSIQNRFGIEIKL